MKQSLVKCQSCQNEYIGNYCNLCGERVFDVKQRKISVLFAHLIESLFNLNGKLICSFRFFISKPGFLAYEHWRGVRQPYMTPVAFFVLVNIIYFIFSPISDFALPLSSQAMQPYSAWIQPVIENYLATNEVGFEEMALRYDTLSGAMAKSLVILSVPFLIPFIYLANPTRKYYLLDHSVSGLYIYAFVLFWPMVLGSATNIFYKVANDWTIPNGLLLFILLFSYYVYCSFFQLFMYRDPYWACLIKGLVITIGIAISHFIYRYLQFCIVWWQVT